MWLGLQSCRQVVGLTVCPPFSTAPPRGVADLLRCVPVRVYAGKGGPCWLVYVIFLAWCVVLSTPATSSSVRGPSTDVRAHHQRVAASRVASLDAHVRGSASRLAL